MGSKSIAILGFGDLGERLCALLPASRWRRYGLRRNPLAVPEGVEGVGVDLLNTESLRVLSEIQPDVLVVALTPAERSVAGYAAGFAGAMRSILEGLAGFQPRQAFFVSSTRVYAEAAGGWVDEHSVLADSDPFARSIIQAEESFLQTLSGAFVLRAAGLYGHSPGPLLKRVAAGRLTPCEPLRYGNRVHRDDVAGFVAHCIDNPVGSDAEGRIVNLVDEAPVALQEVEAWFCEQLGRPYSPQDIDPGVPPARHKRIRSNTLRASAYALLYPDYRSGYSAALREWLAHSER